MDISYIWTGWEAIWHTLLIGTVGYLTLVILLRGTGPRPMAKTAPLDFVITAIDVHTAARQSGQGSLADVQAVILQADGTLGVIGTDAMGDGSSVLPFVERE